MLTLLIRSVSAEVETYCNRIRKSKYSKTFDRRGPDVVLLDQYPVLAASVDGAAVDSSDLLLAMGKR